MSHLSAIMITSGNTFAAVDSLGVIRVEGPDAANFLHAQLTQNLLVAGPGSVRFAAWLDPRGRVVACMDVIAGSSGYDLLCPATLLETLARRLRLFVLRARVTVNVLADLRCHALLGDAAGRHSDADIPLDMVPGTCREIAGATWLSIAPGLVYAYSADRLPGADATADATEQAELAEIALGRPRVDTGTSGTFTAHMLNLDRLGAVAFDKGCYPGQEVVARTHNLGTPKRRMFGFSADAPDRPAPGDPVTDAAGEPVGNVVRAARSGNGVRLLAVVRTDTAATALTLAATGTALTRCPVPGEPAA